MLFRVLSCFASLSLVAFRCCSTHRLYLSHYYLLGECSSHAFRIHSDLSLTLSPLGIIFVPFLPCVTLCLSESVGTGQYTGSYGRITLVTLLHWCRACLFHEASIEFRFIHSFFWSQQLQFQMVDSAFVNRLILVTSEAMLSTPLIRLPVGKPAGILSSSLGTWFAEASWTSHLHSNGSLSVLSPAQIPMSMDTVSRNGTGQRTFQGHGRDGSDHRPVTKEYKLQDRRCLLASIRPLYSTSLSEYLSSHPNHVLHPPRPLCTCAESPPIALAEFLNDCARLELG